MAQGSPSSERRHRDSRARSDSRDRRYGRDERSRREEYDSRDNRRQDYDRSRRDRSPRPRRDQRADRSRSPPLRSRAALPSQVDSFRTEVGEAAHTPAVQKEMPNYKPTGILAKEANTVIGTTTVLKYHEPPEARKPPANQQWRMYIFKGKDLVDTTHLYQRSCWLIGRDKTITDLYLEHPSISKQHAVIQFRFSSATNEYGDKINKVKPYLIDLESANGTTLNDKRVEESRYLELVDGDVIRFANSEREYVMMLPTPDKK